MGKQLVGDVTVVDSLALLWNIKIQLIDNWTYGQLNFANYWQLSALTKTSFYNLLPDQILISHSSFHVKIMSQKTQHVGGIHKRVDNGLVLESPIEF